MESSSELDKRQVLAVIDRELRAVNTGDVDAYLAVLSDDARFMPPNSSPKSGNELRRWLADFIRDFSTDWLKFIHEETVVAGDYAYHTYTYSWRLTPKAGGEPIIGDGKGLHILRRGDDGSWKITREIWNASPAE